ncbi:MAG: HNH endonuclease [Chitinophagales bacterium]|nr:HNH endonuclease [Chitinophagales bacterium]
MSTYISDSLRQEVAFRANARCEYCLLPDSFAIYPFEIDHIIALKHGGDTSLGNLAYCCMRCNRQKGTDLATLSDDKMHLVPLYNPRKDKWHECFSIERGFIYGKNEVGQATVKLLAFNEPPERVYGRLLLIEAGTY